MGWSRKERSKGALLQPVPGQAGGTTGGKGHGKEEPANSQVSTDWGCEPAGLIPINPWEANKLHTTCAAGACGRDVSKQHEEDAVPQPQHQLCEDTGLPAARELVFPKRQTHVPPMCRGLGKMGTSSPC